jgi:hypothetical protein
MTNAEDHVRKLRSLINDAKSACSHFDSDADYAESRVRGKLRDMESVLSDLERALKLRR